MLISPGDQFALAVGAAAANTGWNFADLLPLGAPDGVPDTIQAADFDEVNGVVTQVP